MRKDAQNGVAQAIQAAHVQTNRQTDRTWGDAATYRGVKEFQNSLQVKVAAAT